MPLIFMLIMFVVMVGYSVHVDYRKESVYRYERQEWSKEREYYKQERQQLLDRIQAPSFDHLKQAEIRLTKVQNNEKEPPKLEQL